MLANNIDFYQLVINNKYTSYIGYVSNPNIPVYTILHYYILYPLGLVTFNFARELWLIMNCLLVWQILTTLLSQYPLKENRCILIIVLFLLSKPLVYSIAIGQFSIFALYAFVAYFFIKNKLIRIISIIFAFTKLTFAPILGIYLIIKKEKLIISLLIITHLLAVLIFSLNFENSFIQNFIYQFSIPKKFQTSGAIDFMTIIGNNPPAPFNFIVSIFISSVIFILYYQNTIRDPLADLSIISLITIIFIRHLYYDMVFLLPILIFLIREKKINKICFFIIIYFWFFYFNDYTYTSIRYNKFFMIINFFISLNLIIYLYKKNKISNNKIDKIYEKFF